MHTVGKMFVFSVMATLVIGCAGMDVKKAEEPTLLDYVVATYEGYIEMLNAHSAELTAEIARIEGIPARSDSLSEEIRATDLVGMELRLEQRKILLDHCVLAKRLLQEAKKNPGKKKELQAQWAQHQEPFLNALVEMDKKEGDVKWKRMKLELQQVQDALQ